MACYYTLSSRSLNRESACHIQADCSDGSKDHFCTIQTTTRRQQRRQATPSSHSFCSFCERSQKLVRRKFRRLFKAVFTPHARERRAARCVVLPQDAARRKEPVGHGPSYVHAVNFIHTQRRGRAAHVELFIIVMWFIVQDYIKSTSFIYRTIIKWFNAR